MNLNITQNILVIFALALAIIWFGIKLSKPNTDECEAVKRYANDSFRGATAYDDKDYTQLEKSSHYANYYEAFCD